MRLFRTLLLLVAGATALPTALVVAVLVQARGGVDGAVLGAVGASAALAVVLSAAVARSFSRPIAECVRGALEIARGRFGREVNVRTGNEIGDLAYTFNHMSRELASYDGENRRLIAALERGYLETIRSLASAVDAKDPYTRGHAERVSRLAVEIGRELALPADALQVLEYAGVLHDVGKIGIPDRILAKTEPLTGEEMALVREHPRIGAEIIGGVEFLAAAVPAIRSHHERWDGAGYPDRLAGDAIPLPARIVSAADLWDACTSDRPYQRALSPAEALRVVEKLRGAQLDPAVADALVAVLGRRGALAARGAGG